MIVDANSLPIHLRDVPQWVCWQFRMRGGKQTKVPLVPSTGSFASTTDPASWGSFDDALAYAAQHPETGIGFVFTREDDYVGIDIDGCRDAETGRLSEEATDIVRRLDSYAEVSPSGTGVHILARGELPIGRRRHGSVEMYDRSRFFTMTGDWIPGTPSDVCTRARAIRTVHRQYLIERSRSSVSSSRETARTLNFDSESSASDSESYRTLKFETHLSDEEVLERAQEARNGRKFTALWKGSQYGYDSRSEADMALCCLLAFWTDKDASRIDALFRQSGRMRAKWDEVHFADGATYGERTVERAREQVTETYSR